MPPSRIYANSARLMTFCRTNEMAPSQRQKMEQFGTIYASTYTSLLFGRASEALQPIHFNQEFLVQVSIPDKDELKRKDQ